MRKILFVANIHKHFNAFHIPYIQYLQSKGYEVHVAANDPDTRIYEADKQFNLPINRRPFSLHNIRAIHQLKKIIEKENYCLIHCHTAMGSVIARLAARDFRKKGNLKVLYTAHGFHFFNGSPNRYWLLYFPMELYLSKYTDALITINEEDFSLVRKKFPLKNIIKIPGVGLNVEKFKGLSINQREAIRIKNGYSNDTFIIIYIAEFITRKDHKFILESISLIRQELSDFKFIFAGRGQLRESLEEIASKLGVLDYVDFVGFRKDIGEFIIMSDLGVSVSKQEGLPMNVAELMYAKKTVLVSKTRGHVDLIEDGVTGFLYNLGNKEEFVKKILTIFRDKNINEKISENAKERIKEFELNNCLLEMSNIYFKFI